MGTTQQTPNPDAAIDQSIAAANAKADRDTAATKEKMDEKVAAFISKFRLIHGNTVGGFFAEGKLIKEWEDEARSSMGQDTPFPDLKALRISETEWAALRQLHMSKRLNDPKLWPMLPASRSALTEMLESHLSAEGWRAGRKGVTLMGEEDKITIDPSITVVKLKKLQEQYPTTDQKLKLAKKAGYDTLADFEAAKLKAVEAGLSLAAYQATLKKAAEEPAPKAQGSGSGSSAVAATPPTAPKSRETPPVSLGASVRGRDSSEPYQRSQVPVTLDPPQAVTSTVNPVPTAEELEADRIADQNADKAYEERKAAEASGEPILLKLSEVFNNQELYEEYLPELTIMQTVLNENIARYPRIKFVNIDY